MDTPSPRYILTRAIFFILATIAVLYGMRFYNNWSRQKTVIAELKSISSDSSYYHQFYTADAKIALVRAVGLIAEANKLGISPETAIARATGTEKKTFVSDADMEEAPLKTQIIISNLRMNYENFVKLGYQADFKTLADLKTGELPTIPTGPAVGLKPEVGTIIDPAASPGIDKVLANLEIRPARTEPHVPTDLEVSAAKRLAADLADAGIIEDKVKDRIVQGLTKQPDQ